MKAIHNDGDEKPRGDMSRRHICSTSDWVRSLGLKGVLSTSRTILQIRRGRRHSSTGRRREREKDRRTGKETGVRRRRGRVTMEYAGAVEVEPPIRGGDQDRARATGWAPSSDGRTIRPREEASWESAVRALREMVARDDGHRGYAGVLAAYDTDSRDLVILTVSDGRVTRRTARKPQVRRSTNVIDLATHRRSISRQIS
jgi:hypothetical protein